MSRGERQTSSELGGHRAGPQYQSGLQRSRDYGAAQTRVAGSSRNEALAAPPDLPIVQPLPPRDGDGEPGTMPAGKALFAGIVALLLAMVLNADQLVRDAERKEFGRGRDISLAVWEPVAAFADALWLNEARSVADQALGREFGNTSVVFVVETSTGEPSDESKVIITSTSVPLVEVGPDTAGSTAITSSTFSTESRGDSTTSISVTTTSTSTTEARRVPSSEAPLGLWVGGDSMAQVFGQSLVRLAADLEVIDSTLDFRISTGLTRPDYFNWPTHFADIIAEDNPEVMIVIFGANDAQGMALSTGVFQPFDDEWVAEYRARVGSVMTQLTKDSERIVLWVGQPRMRSDDFDAKMQTLNSIYQSEAERFEQIVYVDTVPLFSASDGTYNAFLPALDGETRDLRQQDGTHLTRAGGDLLADAVLDLVGKDIDLTDPAASTTTTSIVGNSGADGDPAETGG